jgi:hypothetical protein
LVEVSSHKKEKLPLNAKVNNQSTGSVWREDNVGMSDHKTRKVVKDQGQGKMYTNMTHPFFEETKGTALCCILW